MGKKVYFASPFFKPDQIEREERVKTKLRSLGFEVFSPKEFFVLKPDASEEDRDRIFAENIKQITACDIFFGISDERDMGTIWECGCVYGINQQTAYKRKIVYYCLSSYAEFARQHSRFPNHFHPSGSHRFNNETSQHKICGISLYI